MELDRKGCERYVKLLINSLDPDWLYNEHKRIIDYSPKKNPHLDYEKQFHPLALQIHLVKEHFEICKRDSSRKITQEILGLALLGSHIEYFNKNSEGLDEKICELMSPNYENFEKTVYELNVARGFAEKGHSICFVEREQNKKTPDMLLDNEIEVECKKKNERTKRNDEINNFWNLIERKSEKIMSGYSVNYFISVKTYEDPTKDVIDRIIHRIHKLIKKRERGTFFDSEAEITLFKISDKEEMIETSILPQTLQSRDTDSIKKQVIETIKNKTGFDAENLFINKDSLIPVKFEAAIRYDKVFVKNMRATCCNTLVSEDRISSIVESVRKARKQLTGKRPGLICVDLNKMASTWSYKDFELLPKMIQEFIKNNSSISAVLITNELYPEDSKSISFEQERHLFRNKNARFPLLKNFNY